MSFIISSCKSTSLRLFAALLVLMVWSEGYECFSQSSHQIFEHLTTDQGLSSNKVEAVLQDREGFYWIATQNGLNRFDGTTFKIYRHHSEDSTSLTHNYCTGIVEGRNGDIWVATYKGVSRFRKEKGYFQPVYLHHPSRNFEITNRIYALAVDKAGNIWIAGNGLWKYNVETDSMHLFKHDTADISTIPRYSLLTQLVYDPVLDGLWCITGNELIFYSIPQHLFLHKRHNPFGWTVFEHADSRELALDSKNRLWFRDRMTQALSYYESDQNKVTVTSKKVDHGIKQICPDEKNRIWIFYWLAEAEIFDPETSLTDTGFFSNYHRQSALSGQGGFLFIDHQKNHWIASDKGISIYKEANQYYKLHYLPVSPQGDGKVPLKINALAQNEPGYIWIATNEGLYKYDLLRGHARQIHIPATVKAITTIYCDGEKLWLGIYDHLLCMDTRTESVVKKIFINPGIFFIREGKDPTLWIGLWTGGLYKMNIQTNALQKVVKNNDLPSSIKSNNLITGMSDGNDFWVGYNAGVGFSRYTHSTDTWSHFHPQENDLSNSNAGTVTVITKGQDDLIWLGTHGSGIFSFDPVSQQYEHYEQHHGLSSNYINSILSDTTGHLWISTADGINYLNTEKNSIRSLDLGLIFPDNDFAANGITGLNNKLYFFCGNEFAEVDPGLYHPDHTFPQLVISRFTIFDKDKALPGEQEEMDLSYRENYFSFGFSAIRTHPTKEVRYAYKLEGFDQDWINTGTPNASYTNVPDGNYLFKVKVTNDEGEWSEALIHIPLHIKPPFWRTWWFISACLIFLLSAAYLFYQYRIQQIKKLFAVRTKISQDLHDDIGASLSSIHFTSSMADMEVEENPGKAKELLKQINQNSRQVIENISDIVWANNVGQKENSSLAGRIKNYGYDLLSPKNIECTYQIDVQAEKKLSNPEARRNVLLIIKEAMNNIAKYSKAEHAEVRVALNGSHLLVDILDDGTGFDVSTAKNGNGLKNMKKRTDSLQGSFQLHSSPGKGTKIHCSIPIPNISDT